MTLRHLPAADTRTADHLEWIAPTADASDAFATFPRLTIESVMLTLMIPAWLLGEPHVAPHTETT